MTTVDIIAAGYKWKCPRCGWLNRESEIYSDVKCVQCKKSFKAKHAFIEKIMDIDWDTVARNMRNAASPAETAQRFVSWAFGETPEYDKFMRDFLFVQDYILDSDEKSLRYWKMTVDAEIRNRGFMENFLFVQEYILDRSEAELDGLPIPPMPKLEKEPENDA